MPTSFEYLDLLQEGDAAAIAKAFAGPPIIDDPRSGRVEGREALARFVAETAVWLDERSARGMQIASTRNQQREVQEWVLNLDIGEDGWNLPVAVVLDGPENALREIRVYHSMWPLMGAHAIRSPILPELASLVLPDVIQRYEEGLTRGDVARLLQQFETNGVVREPTGEQHVYRGMAELRHFFGKLLATGGIFRERCSLTDDGRCCALEYNVTAWDGLLLPHQAGIAVYERARTGLLAATRIYDDVELPSLPS